MRAFLGAARLQFQIVGSDRGYLNEILTNPFFAIIFLGVVRAARRDDLTSFALVAPVLITVWAMSLEISGEVVDSDRHMGILEQVVVAPAGLTVAVIGRVAAVSLLSFVAVIETLLVAVVGFQVDIPLHHPEVVVAGLLATTFAATGTALVMAAVFVLARTARTFQNTLNYPIYLVAGVLVPISFLPDWVHPISRCIFLSWSADLLRDGLQPDPVTDVLPRLGVVLLLGAVGLAAGRVVLGVVLRRVRVLGTIGHA